MTTIDWSQAGSSATTAFDDKVQQAAGQIVLGIDDLMGDASVPRQVKLAIVQQLGTVLADRQQLQQLLSGQPVQGAAALGGGNSTGGTPAGYVPQADHDALRQEKDRADAQNRILLKDRQLLEQIVLALGLTTPADTNTAFGADTPQKVQQKVQDKATQAVSSAGLVRKTEVMPQIDQIEGKAAALHTSMLSNGIEGKGELDAAIAAAKALVS